MVAARETGLRAAILRRERQFRNHPGDARSAAEATHPKNGKFAKELQNAGLDSARERDFFFHSYASLSN
jgi:hypothetical protein